jgi:hypothetical protein
VKRKLASNVVIPGDAPSPTGPACRAVVSGPSQDFGTIRRMIGAASLRCGKSAVNSGDDHENIGTISRDPAARRQPG